MTNSVQKINNAIEVELSNLIWGKIKFTTEIKISSLLAIRNVLKEYPEEMSKYICSNSRSGGFQNKLFKEFIYIFENKLPIVFYKNKSKNIIDNLLEPGLNIFQGKSTFTSIINNNICNNNTNEIYIGGRKSSYIKKYYIGKLLSVNYDGYDITKKVKDYNFNNIYFKNMKDNSQIEVSHLMVVPHYQMGGMLYINKALKTIRLTLNELKLKDKSAALYTDHEV